MAREYIALCAGNVDRLKDELNRLSQEGWKRIQSTEGSEWPFFTVTASRKYQTCAYGDCKVRLYRGEWICPEHVRRCAMEHQDLCTRQTCERRCVEASCVWVNVGDIYCEEHEAEADANFALKGKASE